MTRPICDVLNELDALKRAIEARDAATAMVAPLVSDEERDRLLRVIDVMTSRIVVNVLEMGEEP